jgi:hypothetical protein
MSQDRNQQLTYCQGIKERKGVISAQNVQESITYSLSRHQRKKKGDKWTECHRTGINNLHAVKASEKEKGSSVDKMSQDRDQQLTFCQGIRQRKGVIGGQNVTGQESTTYILSRHQRKKRVISGQNVTGQESTTYILSRHQRKKRGDQWTKCHRTGINNLQAAKASEKEKG